MRRLDACNPARYAAALYAAARSIEEELVQLQSRAQHAELPSCAFIRRTIRRSFFCGFNGTVLYRDPLYAFPFFLSNIQITTVIRMLIKSHLVGSQHSLIPRKKQSSTMKKSTIARVLLLCCIAWILDAATEALGDVLDGDNADTAAPPLRELLHLYPEQPRSAEQIRCGDTQLYRIHDLDPRKVYDVKVSYPASIPTDFFLEVDDVMLPPPVSAADAPPMAGVKGTMRVRRRILNTSKLRLHPHELLLQALGKDPIRANSVNAYRLDLQNGKSGGHAAAASLVTVDISLRAEVEGVSPTIDRTNRECVFDIVVEEMLFGAFPYDTLVLIVWLVALLLLALRWVYPYMLKKIALELPEEHIHVSGSNIKES